MSAANRFRRLVGVHGGRIAAVLLVVGVLALAGAAATYANPPTEVVTEERNAQTISASTNVSTVVTGPTPLYDEGERLSDLPVYFFDASPDLTLSVRTTVPDGQAVSVTQRLFVHMEASRNGDLFWDERRVVAANEQTVRDGPASLETTLNMSDVRTDFALRESAIGGVGSVDAEFRLVVTYETDRYSGELTASSPIVFSENAYWLDDDLEGSRTHSETVQREVTQPPDVATAGSFAGVGLLSIAGAVVLFRLRRDGLDPDDVRTNIVHERYEEWISTGEFPTGTEKKHVKIESLEDLVDIGIDSNKRVVFDPEFAAYAVVDGDLIYYYSTDPRRIDSWLDV